jgi:hypothetical protein
MPIGVPLAVLGNMGGHYRELIKVASDLGPVFNWSLPSYRSLSECMYCFHVLMFIKATHQRPGLCEAFWPLSAILEALDFYQRPSRC